MKLIIFSLVALLIFAIWVFHKAAYLPDNSIFGPVINQMSIQCKSVALTFDDGPVEPYTTEILDILKTNNVKATFFLIGKNVDKFPASAKRMVLDGHVIGNHTYSHPDLIWLNQQQIHSELSQTETSIVRATGQKPLLFRPPYGRRSPLLFPVAKDFGYKVILWSIDPVDWHAKNSSISVDLILNEVKPGSIILLHDGVEDQPKIQFDRNNTVEALPKIIEGLKNKGFCFVTISEMLSN